MKPRLRKNHKEANNFKVILLKVTLLRARGLLENPTRSTPHNVNKRIELSILSFVRIECLNNFYC